MLKQRLVTSLILAPVVIAGIFWLPLPLFSLFVAVVVCLGAWEWANLSGWSNRFQRLLYVIATAVVLYVSNQFAGAWQNVLIFTCVMWVLVFVWVCRYPAGQKAWSNQFVLSALGVWLLLTTWMSLVQLKSFPHGNTLIFYLFLLVWGADVGAYFSGKKWGNKKLAPSVSPGKSWAGVYGGISLTFLITLYGAYYYSFTLVQTIFVLIMSFVVVSMSVLGDLFESMVKRHRGVKDSSHLLPGHGGIMDRIDSLTAAAPWFALALMLINWH